MIPLNETIGTAAGYAVSQVRRAAVPSEGVNGRTTLAVEMSKGANRHVLATIEDHGMAGAEGRQIGLAVLKALTIAAAAA